MEGSQKNAIREDAEIMGARILGAACPAASEFSLPAPNSSAGTALGQALIKKAWALGPVTYKLHSVGKGSE